MAPDLVQEEVWSHGGGDSQAVEGHLSHIQDLHVHTSHLPSQHGGRQTRHHSLTRTDTHMYVHNSVLCIAKYMRLYAYMHCNCTMIIYMMRNNSGY